VINAAGVTLLKSMVGAIGPQSRVKNIRRMAIIYRMIMLLCDIWCLFRSNTFVRRPSTGHLLIA